MNWPQPPSPDALPSAYSAWLIDIGARIGASKGFLEEGEALRRAGEIIDNLHTCLFVRHVQDAFHIGADLADPHAPKGGWQSSPIGPILGSCIGDVEKMLGFHDDQPHAGLG